MPVIDIKYDPSKITDGQLIDLKIKLLSVVTENMPGINNKEEVTISDRKHGHRDMNTLSLEIAVIATETEERLRGKEEIHTKIISGIKYFIPIKNILDEKSASLWLLIVPGEYSLI